MSLLALRPGNPMARVLGATLIFEVIVAGLGAFGMVFVSNRSIALAALTSGLVALACLGAAATLRRRAGYVLGWAAQVALVLLGLLTAMMFLVGGMFALIWVMSFVLGRRIDAGALQSRP